MSKQKQEAEFLRRVKESPAFFRSIINIEAGREVRKLADAMDDWQRRDFEVLDDAWRCIAGHDVTPKIMQGYRERGRGLSKTSDGAVAAIWALLASPRRLTGVVAAGDKDQAGYIRDAITRLLIINPWLAQFIDVQKERVVAKHTGSELLILSSDGPSSYGLLIDFAILEELTHHRNRELFDSIMSATIKRPAVAVLVITNAGFLPSWQADFREAVRKDQAWDFSTVRTSQASWMNPERLEQLRRILVSDIAYRRVVENEWIAGGGDALTENDIKAATCLFSPLAAPEQGWQYLAGLDLGVSKDASALVVIGQHVGHWQKREIEPRRIHPHFEMLIRQGIVDAPPEEEPEADWIPGSGRMRLAACKVWQPTKGQRVSLEDVKQTTLALHRVFKFVLGFDPSQAELMGEQLRAAGVMAEPMPFVGPNLKSMCQATLDAFTERQIDLYDEPRLLADLRALRVEERQYGVRLVSPRGPSGHGDAATALSIALLMAKRYAGSALSGRVDRPLVCYP